MYVVQHEDGLCVSAISQAVGANLLLILNTCDALKKKQLDMGKPVMKLQQTAPFT